MSRFRLLPDLEREGNLIRAAWDRLRRVPGGSWAFSRLLGRAAPYTGNIQGEVLELRDGYGRVRMRDRPELRNHLDSVHAIALANLGELCGNVSLAYSMPDDARFIVAGLTMDYRKKARGTITAESRPPRVTNSERVEYPVLVEMKDEQGDLVATATLRTLIGPKKRK